MSDALKIFAVGFAFILLLLLVVTYSAGQDAAYRLEMARIKAASKQCGCGAERCAVKD